MAIKVVTPTNSSPQDLQQLIKRGMSDDDIEFLLTESYKDDFLVRNLMVEVKRMRNSQKTTTGLILVLVGAFIMLLGFVFAFIGSSSEMMLNIFLYCFTTVGIIIARWAD